MSRKNKSKKKDEMMMNVPEGDYIQSDWEMREWFERMNSNVLEIVETLNRFSTTSTQKLAIINTKIELLERHMDYLEAKYAAYNALTPSDEA